MMMLINRHETGATTSLYAPMHVIRHSYKFIKNDLFIMNWQIIPAFVHDFAKIVR